MNDRTYDLLMWAQNTLPAGDPYHFLNGFFRSSGGSNHAKINSTKIDSLLDTLASKDKHKERQAACDAVQKEVQTEVPMSNLVTPNWHVSVSSRMADYKPWGSDYYVIRSDLSVTPPPTPTPPPSGSAGFIAVPVGALLIATLICD